MNYPSPAYRKHTSYILPSANVCFPFSYYHISVLLKLQFSSHSLLLLFFLFQISRPYHYPTYIFIFFIIFCLALILLSSNCFCTCIFFLISFFSKFLSPISKFSIATISQPSYCSISSSLFYVDFFISPFLFPFNISLLILYPPFHLSFPRILFPIFSLSNPSFLVIRYLCRNPM